MALFGEERDISFMRHINRELMGNIITQQASFYKFIPEKTNTNIYGESSEGKYYDGPIIFNCLIDRNDQQTNVMDMISDLEWKIKFAFLKDDLIDKNIVPLIGDLIMYNNSYFETDNIISNQFLMGKDPDYPNSPNPLNTGLEKFGWDNSIICECHIIPSDKVNITNER